ncbi:MAM and LDL-receptor class A domain-containing protein 1 [Amia ocellicauda]|uniref:MAM and LDL-receptor class A domain-containing protein 1 n=1 Tax=Amia ocellicauda TaxID=2972642 RepID=UPI003463BC1C
MGAAELLLRVVLAALWLQSVTALPVNGGSRRAQLNGGALAPLQRRSTTEDLHAALEAIDAIHDALLNDLLSQLSRQPGTGEHGMSHGSGMGQDTDGHGGNPDAGGHGMGHGSGMGQDAGGHVSGMAATDSPSVTESLGPVRALNPTELQSTASEPHTTAVLPQSTVGVTKHSTSALMSGHHRHGAHHGHAHDHLQLASLNSLFCNFEMDLCAWTQSGTGHSHWLLHRERPGAFEGVAVSGEDGCRNKAGQYLYMQSSYQHSQGYTAELRSWELTGAACLSFWYSVFGAGVDSLSVYLVYSESSLGRRLVWSDGGKETRQWYLETLDLAVTGAQKYRLVFIGTIGNGCNDAVLDDLEVWGQPCASVYRSTSKTAITTPSMTANGGNFSTTTASSSTNGGNLPATENGTASITANLATLLPTTARLGNATSAPPGSVLLYCSFESSLCGWTQFQGDDFDWRLHRERELTAGVHESRAGCRNLGGQYLYIEAISPRKTGDRAVLLSPPLSGSVCLRFWYSLLGQGVDSLSVYVLFLDTPELRYRLWERQGSSARVWARAQVPLSVEPDRSFQLVLEGVLGEQPCGDAALDELMIARGRCRGQ